MYFLIAGMEDGVRFRKFNCKSGVVEYLKDYYENEEVKFYEASELPEHSDDFYSNRVVVIRGDIVIPKAITIVKSFDID